MQSHANKNEDPQLCMKCKKFYGTSNLNFMCSKCYKETVQPLSPPPDTLTLSEQNKDGKASEGVVKEAIEICPSENDQKCFKCYKKVGYYGFKCKCQKIFCINHRQATQHACQYDYKAEAKAQLEKLNPLVVSEKIKKI